MLWSEEFCYLHLPKTAGKSITKAFVNSWGRPLNGLVSLGQVKDLSGCNLNGVNLEVGGQHKNLVQAEKFFKQHGRALDDFDAIFVSIRNPYDRMVSNYHFMRENYKYHRDRVNFKLAHECDFDEFCESVTLGDQKNWMELNGVVPDNLRIIRFENIERDLKDVATEFGFQIKEIPHLNSSTHSVWHSYITPRSEKKIFERFNYFFANGYYERFVF